MNENDIYKIIDKNNIDIPPFEYKKKKKSFKFSLFKILPLSVCFSVLIVGISVFTAIKLNDKDNNQNNQVNERITASINDNDQVNNISQDSFSLSEPSTVESEKNNSSF